MSFLWNTFRLHGARALVPKSRLARVGLGTAVAVGAGVSYISWRMEQDFASDEFQSDPPLPPELDWKYRAARWALDNDMPSEAWPQLVQLLQTYVTPDLDLSDPDKVAVLASIGESLVEAGLAAQDVDPARLHDVALTILPAILGSGMATTREHLRAIQLAWCLSYTVVEDDCSQPFLQWATMQSLDLASQLDPVPSNLLDVLSTIMTGNKGPDDLWSCIPVMLATVVRFDSSIGNDDAIQTDLRRLLQLRLAQQYLHILLFSTLEEEDPPQRPLAVTLPQTLQLQRRIVSLMDVDAIPKEVRGEYRNVLGHLAFLVGLQYAKLGDGKSASELFVLAFENASPDSNVHNLVKTLIIKAVVKAEEK